MAGHSSSGGRKATSLENPSLNSIHKGVVTTVKDFGAFVKIPGFFKHGLIHRSQLSKCNVNDPNDVLQTGDNVWCKVISINDEGKIGLSMKVVNQGNGKDLDPNGVEIAQDERKRQTHVPYKQEKITLDAVFKTTCKKCGTAGHLAQDCFQVPGGKTYEILADDDEVKPTEDKRIEETKEKIKHKKRNKHHHKNSPSKKKRRRSSSSEDDSHHGKSKKHKSKKKKNK